jgi:hypothetical protein
MTQIFYSMHVSIERSLLGLDTTDNAGMELASFEK